MQRRVQAFEVSLKAFIVRDDRVLVVREADTGYWELPGGRIDEGEEWAAHDAVLLREIAEEAGPDLLITISERALSWVRQRPEDGCYQFIVGRVCGYAGGAVRLSSEHDAYDWCTNEQSRALPFPPHSGYLSALERLWRLCS